MSMKFYIQAILFSHTRPPWLNVYVNVCIRLAKKSGLRDGQINAVVY